LEYDSLFLVLGAGLVVSLVMTLAKGLAKSTRRRTGFLCFLYAIALSLFYNEGFCTAVSDVLKKYMSCQRVLVVRQDLASNWIGTEPVGVLASLSGIVGFTISASGTQSGKWQFLAAVLLGLFVLAFIGRFVLPVFSPSSP
jgi:hypothetical protein